MDMSHFDTWIEKSKENKKTFTTKEIGSSASLVFESGTKQRFSEYGSNFSGAHICRMVYLHIEKLLRDGEYFPKNTNNNRTEISTVIFDKEQIARCVAGKIKCKAIDIKRCYWNTAHILGIINDKIYEYGMKGGTSWKDARNIAIGSLGAFVTERNYKDGLLVKKTDYRRPLNVVRLDIIDHVWKIANEIIQLIQNGFCMYLTDCFFVTEKCATKVEKLIAKYGYESKTEPVTFTQLEVISEKAKFYKAFWIKGDDESKISFHYFTGNNLIEYNENENNRKTVTRPARRPEKTKTQGKRKKTQR
jgi:hypothetical protein